MWQPRGRSVLTGLLTLIGCMPGCQPRPQPVGVPFPAVFQWGAASAAHQVEGGNTTNDWWLHEQQPGTIAHGDRSGEAVDHYHQFDRDFAEAAAMGHTAHRLSIEWSRIEPTQGHYDEAAWRHYDAVFASLARHHLRPMVTLWHFTNPQWTMAQGGWLNPRTGAAWVTFVEAVVARYQGQVRDWITLNEPNVYGFHAYDIGLWPPRHKNRDEAITAIINLLKAHGQASRAIHRLDPTARVGIANHIALFAPQNRWNPLDHLKAYLVDNLFNRMPIEAQVTGRIRVWAPGVTSRDETVPELAGSVDFIGLNYYTRWRQSVFDSSDQLVTAGAPVNDLGWEYYPEGLHEALLTLRPYHLPVVVTENGTADRSDRQRSALLTATFQGLRAAMADGIDLRGYYHWSLLDNFEWADGFRPAFGLMHVDRAALGMPRTWRPSAYLYRDLIRAARPAGDVAVGP
ncbi:MAG: glycoside hydrolase family 1 protein [Candidatus Sericytochromatia bacterium]|nr:glycoside hydrolase family 1 protein [Candidatus Sericytochromatia bacterium]